MQVQDSVRVVAGLQRASEEGYCEKKRVTEFGMIGIRKTETQVSRECEDFQTLPPLHSYHLVGFPASVYIYLLGFGTVVTECAVFSWSGFIICSILTLGK